MRGRRLGMSQRFALAITASPSPQPSPPNKFRGEGAEAIRQGTNTPNCTACRISVSSAARRARDELFTRAKKLGYRALAITDECSLAGIVRAYEASKETGIALIVGTEIRLADGPKLVVLAVDHDGYSRYLPADHHRPPAQRQGRISADARRCRTNRARRVRVVDCRESAFRPREFGRTEASRATKTMPAHGYASTLPAAAWLAVELHRGPDDGRRARASARTRCTPRPAAGRCRRRAHARAPAARAAGRDDRDPSRLHGRRSRACAVPERRAPSARARAASPRIYPRELLAETLRIAGACTFNLDETAVPSIRTNSCRRE